MLTTFAARTASNWRWPRRKKRRTDTPTRLTVDAWIIVISTVLEDLSDDKYNRSTGFKHTVPSVKVRTIFRFFFSISNAQEPQWNLFGRILRDAWRTNLETQYSNSPSNRNWPSTDTHMNSSASPNAHRLLSELKHSADDDVAWDVWLAICCLLQAQSAICVTSCARPNMMHSSARAHRVCASISNGQARRFHGTPRAQTFLHGIPHHR